MNDLERSDGTERSNGNRARWRLDSVPPSSPPSLQSLGSQLHQRRRRLRTAVATMSTCCVVLVAGMIATGTQFDISRYGWTAASDADADLPTDSIAASDAAGPADGQSMSTGPDDSGIGFKLYADVRSEVPVFQFDHQLGQMVPVGWLRTTETVPVAVERFSPQQVRTFKTILNEETTDLFY